MGGAQAPGARVVTAAGLLLALVIAMACTCDGPGLGNCPPESCDGSTDEGPLWSN